MEQIKEHIFTIEKFHEEKLKEKGSVFIATAYPVNSEKEFQNLLGKIKKNYYDASHHCWAFKLNNDKYKYADDGEPGGTAGIRILNAIDHFNLVDTAVIVTRYFGGTKLGARPLGKVYYASAIKVLENSDQIKCCSYYKISFEIGFDEISHAHRIAGDFKAIINEISYSEKIRFECYIKPHTLKAFSLRISEGLNRTIDIKKESNIFFIKC
jgi:uncharacterized YigZ family protein